MERNEEQDSAQLVVDLQHATATDSYGVMVKPYKSQSQVAKQLEIMRKKRARERILNNVNGHIAQCHTIYKFILSLLIWYSMYYYYYYYYEKLTTSPVAE